MKCAKTLLLSCVAGAACAMPAFADQPALPSVTAVHIDQHGNVINPNQHNYSSRDAVGAVFDNGFATGTSSNVAGSGTSLGTVHWMDDLDLTGGPWAAASGRNVTGYGFAMQSLCSTSTPANALSVYIAIYAGSTPATSPDYTTASMLDPDGDTVEATPIINHLLAITQQCQVQTLYTVGSNNSTTGALNVAWPNGVNKGYIRGRICNSGTTVLRPYAGNGGAQLEGPNYLAGAGPNAIGTITNDYARDIDASSTFNGSATVITGGAANTPLTEHRQVAAPPGTLGKSYRMALYGTIVGVAPTVFVNVGNLVNSSPNPTVPAAQNLGPVSLAAGGVQWYKFAIGAVNDAAGTFLDMDNEGSTAGDDTSMALYDASGNLMNIDSESGTDNLGMLTYGIGRRAPFGNGKDYDGRHGELAAGTYWLAVAAAGVNFSAGWATSGTSAATPGIKTRLRTNAAPAGAGPLDTAVAPTVDLAHDAGSLTVPGVLFASESAGPLNIVWYKFNTSGTNDNLYVDIDTAGGTNTFNMIMALYNCKGEVVLSDDDSGDNILPEMSFGGNANSNPPVAPRAAQGDGLPFNGFSGFLSHGTYYLGVGLTPLTFGAGGNRWADRPTSGSNLGGPITLNTNIMPVIDPNTNLPAVVTHGCCIADYDGGPTPGSPDGGIGIEDLLWYLGLFNNGDIAADIDDGSFDGVRNGGVGIEDLLYFLFHYNNGC